MSEGTISRPRHDDGASGVLAVVDHRLTVLVDGIPQAVLAWDIFQATSRGAATVGGVRIEQSPVESCPGIRFHGAPAEVGVSLSLDDVMIRVKKVAFTAGTAVEVRHPDDHVLAGTDWYPLDPDLNQAVDNWLADVVPTSLAELAKYPELMRGVRAFRTLDQVPDEALVDLLPDTAIPAGLVAQLYAYQVKGYRWLAARSAGGYGALLADEMGLGKTLQVIALLLNRKGWGAPSIVIAPLTIVENWRRELNRFAPTIRTYIHLGPMRVRRPAAMMLTDVVVTSYQTAANDSGMLALVQWDLVIADEAQALRNPDTQRSRLLGRLRGNAKIAMTGTPIENYALDLWSLADFVSPGQMGSRGEFEAHLASDPAGLRMASRPLVLRRLVKDVAADLPERIDVDTAMVMYGPEADAYEGLRRRLLADLGPITPLVALGRLRQFAAHPSLVELKDVDYEGIPSAKFDRLLELLEEIVQNRGKALVFANYRRLIDMIVASCGTRLGVAASSIDGRTPAPQRQRIVDVMSADPAASVLVLNPAAAGVGLNIQAANHVIHYTLEWNPAKQDQATARAWRRGQERPVAVHRLFYSGTVDEVMLERMASKRELAETAVPPREADESEITEILQAALHRSPAQSRQQRFLQYSQTEETSDDPR